MTTKKPNFDEIRGAALADYLSAVLTSEASTATVAALQARPGFNPTMNSAQCREFDIALEFKLRDMARVRAFSPGKAKR